MSLIKSFLLQSHKVFTCDGPYPVDAYVRFSLRKRGWVEKFGAKAGNSTASNSISSNKLECEFDEGMCKIRPLGFRTALTVRRPSESNPINVGNTKVNTKFISKSVKTNHCKWPLWSDGKTTLSIIFYTFVYSIHGCRRTLCMDQPHSKVNTTFASKQVKTCYCI